jgi:RimJ/RimL family protein N-acetyltransferase/catechol 2,3-dioxygenase-like lactoylglutathione lyase family enzyme
MFDHVKFGVSDYAASKRFFLKALEPLGVAVVWEGLPPLYGVELRAKGEASLRLYQSDEKPAHLHIAFTASNRRQVDDFYSAALAAGGKDNGAPGHRAQYSGKYYAAFVIGPDGHNIEVVCHEPIGIDLREVNEGDLPIFFEHQRDPEANRMAAFPSRQRSAFFEHWRINVLGNSSGKINTIAFGKNVAGYVSSWEQEEKRLIGFWIGRDYWGRGIATAALLKFLDYEVSRPLYAYVATQNVGSMRVLEKCGFHRYDNSATGADVDEYLYLLECAK